MISLGVPSRRAAHAGAVLMLIICACGRMSEARDRGGVLPPCPAGALNDAQPLRGTLDSDACSTPAGNRYADLTVSLIGDHAYLIRATDRPDSTLSRSPHRRFDATLLSPGDTAVRLLSATPFEGRDPSHTISQMFFIAPATGRYRVRVRGHEPRDVGAFALEVQPCGGGTLAVGQTSASSLGRGGCLEEMSFGADSGYADLWRLRLAPDQRVGIDLLSEGRGPIYLHIAGPGLAGQEQGGDVNRLRFAAQRGGDYTVLVGQLDFDPAPRPYAIRVTPLDR